MPAYSQITGRLGYFSTPVSLNGLGTNVDGLGRFMVAAPTAANPFQVAVAGGSTVPVLGVLMNQPDVGEGCTIAYKDLLPVRSGAALTVGAQVMSDANGQAIPFVSGSGNLMLGTAMSAATGAGQEISIQTNLALGHM